MRGLSVISDDAEGFDFSAAAAAIYSELGQTGDLAVEISFVSEDEIKELNASYRGADRVTDVLSFPYLDGIKGVDLNADDYPEEVDETTGKLLIGSVCINLKRAEEQAEEYGHSLKREVVYLAVHGMLHCFGYDHVTEEEEAEMTALAEKIMDGINIKRV